MLPDRVSNPGPLTYESGALPIALRGPACIRVSVTYVRFSSKMLFTIPLKVQHHKLTDICHSHSKLYIGPRV